MQPQGKHILTPFDAALVSLRNDLLMMASLTERSLGNARDGFLRRESARCEVAIADDEEIDQLEIQLDREGIRLILRFHPVATDLRRVITTMKVSTNLERIADKAVNIARRSRRVNQLPIMAESSLLGPLFELVVAMVRDSLQAYVEEDTARARAMKARDREVDTLNRRIQQQLTEIMAQSPDRIEGLISLIFIAGDLERIGDLATNIAEDAVFGADAEDIRHLGSSADGGQSSADAADDSRGADA